MNGRQRQRDGEGRRRHGRAVCQHSPVAAPAKICRCVRVEEDLGFGKVCLGRSEVSDFVCVFALLIIFSYIVDYKSQFWQSGHCFEVRNLFTHLHFSLSFPQ